MPPSAVHSVRINTHSCIMQILNTANSMIKAIEAKIQAKVTSSPLGAEDADLDKLRCE